MLPTDAAMTSPNQNPMPNTTASRTRMGRRMPTRTNGSHPPSARLPKLRAVAQALGVSEATAEKKLYGAAAVNLETAVILSVLLERGEIEDATAFEAPVSAAMMGRQLPTPREAQRLCDHADGMEDVAQAEFVSSYSDEALDEYVRKLAAEIFHASRLLSVLKAEQKARAAR